MSSSRPKLILQCLRPGNELLIKGNPRLNAIIEYLTPSTWSHAALHVGGGDGDYGTIDLDAPVLLEAAAEEGVHVSPPAKYAGFNTRICRPFGRGDEGCSRWFRFVRKVQRAFLLVVSTRMRVTGFCL